MRVLIDDNIWNFNLTEALQHISTQRREQALQFRHELGQRQCVLSYLLLKRALHEVYGIDENPLFSYGEHGKPFLTNHPDIRVSRLATTLAIDRHQLMGRFVVEPREGSLRQRVVHLVMDLRLDLISRRLKEIQLAIRQAAGDMEHVMLLMNEYKETQQLRDMLAKKLGSDVVKN